MRSHWLYALVPLFFLAVFPAAAEQEKDDPLRNAALSGDTAAQLKLASEFFFGTDARPRNPVLAVYWYRRAAELGSAEGAYNLGVCYEKGWGVEHRVWCGRAAVLTRPRRAGCRRRGSGRRC